MLLVKADVGVLSRCHRPADELPHGRADDLVGGLVVAIAEIIKGRFPVAADVGIALMLLDAEGRRQLDGDIPHGVQVFVCPVVCCRWWRFWTQEAAGSSTVMYDMAYTPSFALSHAAGGAKIFSCPLCGKMSLGVTPRTTQSFFYLNSPELSMSNFLSPRMIVVRSVLVLLRPFTTQVVRTGVRSREDASTHAHTQLCSIAVTGRVMDVARKKLSYRSKDV